MERFLQQHQKRISGALSGFDRMLFRGTLRSISYRNGMDIFLSSQRVLYKDFGPFVQRLSDRLEEHGRAIAQRQGRPFRYVPSPSVSKEDIARRTIQEDGNRRGPDLRVVVRGALQVLHGPASALQSCVLSGFCGMNNPNQEVS